MADVQLPHRWMLQSGGSSAAHVMRATLLHLTFSQPALSLQQAFAAATCGSPRSREYSLLRSVSGTFRAGRTSLILGPSGGGKSLLLQACCGVCPVDTSGEITLNGQPLSKCCATQNDEVCGRRGHVQLAADRARDAAVRIYGARPPLHARCKHPWSCLRGVHLYTFEHA